MRRDLLVSLSKIRYMSAMKQRVREMTTRTSMIFSKIFCRFPSSSTVCSMVAVLPKKVFFPVNCRAAQGSMSEHIWEEIMAIIEQTAPGCKC